MEFIESCENPNVTYCCLPDIRLIFEDGKYIGWYQQNLEEVLN